MPTVGDIMPPHYPIIKNKCILRRNPHKQLYLSIVFAGDLIYYHCS